MFERSKDENESFQSQVTTRVVILADWSSFNHLPPSSCTYLVSSSLPSLPSFPSFPSFQSSIWCTCSICQAGFSYSSHDSHHTHLPHTHTHTHTHTLYSNKTTGADKTLGGRKAITKEAYKVNTVIQWTVDTNHQRAWVSKTAQILPRSSWVLTLDLLFF